MSIVNDEEGFTELLKLNLRDELLLRGDPVGAIDPDVFATDGVVPQVVDGTFVASGATVDQTTGEWTFERSANFPGGSLGVGNWSISNGGAQISATERSSGQVTYSGASSILDDDVGNLQPFFIQLDGPERLLAIIGSQDTNFTILAGEGHTYNVTNPLAGTATFYKIVNDNLNTSVGCNITIREDSPTNPIPLFDYKRDSDPDGVTIIPGDNDIDLQTEVFFKLGADLFVTITAGDEDIFLAGIDIGGAFGEIIFSENTGRLATFFQVPTTKTLKSLSGQDQYQEVNTFYTSTTPTTAGFVANYQATATKATVTDGQFTEGVATTSNPTIETVEASVFVDTDIIQVTGTRENDGVYEVLSHAANLLTIKGVGVTPAVEDFSDTQLFTIIDSATITKINVSVLRAGTDGDWEVGKGSTTGIVFTKLDATADTWASVLAEGNTSGGTDAVISDGDSITSTSSSEILNITASATTEGTVNIQSDSLTSGYIAKFTSNSSDAGNRNLVEITNDNIAAVQAIPLTVKQDANAIALDVNGGGVTTSRALFVGADNLTTGSIARFRSDSTDANLRNLVEIINDEAAANGATVLKLQQDADHEALVVDGNGIITDNAVEITVDNATIGGGLKVSSDSSNASIRKIVDIINDNVAATQAVCLNLQQDSTRYAMQIAAATTNVAALDIVASGLINGQVARFYSNSASASARSLVQIHNDNVAATQAVCLELLQDSSRNAMTVTTATQNVPAISVVADSLTGGQILRLASDSISTTARSLLEVVNDNPLATNATVLKIQQDADHQAISVDANGFLGVNNSDHAVDIVANGLTSGGAFRAYSNSADASSRILARITNDNVAAAGTIALRVDQDAPGEGVEVIGGGMTTGNVMFLRGDSLTSGRLLNLFSNSAATNERFLVDLANNNSLATGATCMRVTQSANAELMELFGTGVTTNNVVEVTANALTTGSALDIVSNSTDTSIRSLVTINNGNAASTGTRLLELTNTSTGNILAAFTVGTTTGNSVDLRFNSLTTGRGLLVLSDSTDASNRNIVEFINDNTAATGAACLRLRQDANSEALRVSASTTTKNALEIEASSLTSGGIANFYSNSSDAGIRELVTITNDDPAAGGARCLSITQDADQIAVEIVSDGIALDAFGGLSFTPTMIASSTATLETGDSIILVEHTPTAAVTLTLPSDQTAQSGRYIVVKDAGGNASVNNITINTEGSETIDGESTLILDNNYESYTLVSDGNDWFII